MASCALLLSGCGAAPQPTPDPYPNGPQITCPASISATSTSGQPTSLTYPAPAAEGGAPPLTIACTPASGSLFPIGKTTVTCTASDSRQRANTCAFDVTVAAPPKLHLTRFVAFGDSITYGENGISSQAFGFGPLFQVAAPYPTVLYQLLTARYTSQTISVTNAGQPAELASDAGTRGRFDSLVFSGSFDAVLLMEGSNDVSGGVGGAAVSALQRMIDDAKGAGVAPYLATIPPMDGSKCCPRRGSAAPQVPGFNDSVRALAASEGIPLVDVYAALNTAPSQYLSDDGLHPNDAGYQKIGETFFAALKTTLEIQTLKIP